jgi:nucleoside-diphosphate-sugar epimerase
MRILITASHSKIGTFLGSKLSANHEVFFLCKDSLYKTDLNYLSWNNFENQYFDYIFALDSPNLLNLIESYGSNLERLSFQASSLNSYLINNRDTRLIVFSSVSTLGAQQVILTGKERPFKPNLYGIAKLIQEELLTFDIDKHRYCILRLPAILMDNSVIHFPSRVKKALQYNEPVHIHNPLNLWNACLSIDDLFSLIKTVLRNSISSEFPFFPHAEGAITISDLVELMKSSLSSNSKILISDVVKPESGPREIRTSNLITTKEVNEALIQFCQI